MAIELYPHQWEALRKIKCGSILNGGVGSGKSITSLAWYFFSNGGIYSKGFYIDMPGTPPDLYIITTARKRDDMEWEAELNRFLLSTNPEINHYDNKVVVDSWNNIGKYSGVVGATFIFDEQRVVGKGAWVKSFLKICGKNDWILLSATPGDTWEDYIPVFIANGFYKNRTEFYNEHVVWRRFSKFPQVDRYLGTAKLNRLRRQILVDMDFKRKTVQHNEVVWVEYDILGYKKLMKERFNYETQEPIESASELCYELRKICNSDDSRLEAVKRILQDKRKAIIFYNFNYELELLEKMLEEEGIPYKQWNGHKHEAVPDGPNWAYLVQYTAGAEGWNCILTDTIIFYSQNYSYKIMVQSSGRIDRLNTPYVDLYYYHLKSRAGIDLAIAKALKEKKKFNEKDFEFSNYA